MEVKRLIPRKVLILLLLLTLGAMFFGLSSGRVSVTVRAFSQALYSGEQGVFHTLLWQYRIPDMWTALLVGAAISVSGLLMQNSFRNLLAGLYILGISSGASLGVALCVFVGFSAGWLARLSNWALVVAAVIGTLLFMFIIGYSSLRVYHTAALLVAGVLLSAFASSITGMLQYFSDQTRLKTYMVWTFGSLSGLDPAQLSIFAVLALSGLALLFALSKKWDALWLGGDYARSLGIGVQRVKTLFIPLTALLVGAPTRPSEKPIPVYF